MIESFTPQPYPMWAVLTRWGSTGTRSYAQVGLVVGWHGAWPVVASSEDDAYDGELAVWHNDDLADGGVLLVQLLLSQGDATAVADERNASVTPTTAP